MGTVNFEYKYDFLVVQINEKVEWWSKYVLI